MWLYINPFLFKTRLERVRKVSGDVKMRLKAVQMAGLCYPASGRGRPVPSLDPDLLHLRPHVDAI